MRHMYYLSGVLNTAIHSGNSSFTPQRICIKFGVNPIVPY